MFEYSILYIIFFVSAVIQISKNSKSVLPLLIIGVFLSVIVSGFRDMIGGYDIYVYSAYYEYIEQRGNYYNYEYGYYIFNKILYFLNSDRHFLIFTIALIVGISYFIIARKLSPKLYAVVIFIIFCKLYFYSFVYLRQMLAVILIWFAIIQLTKVRRINFIALTLLATQMHLSALIVLPLIIMKKLISKSHMCIFYIFSLFFGLIGSAKIFSILGGSDIEKSLSSGVSVNYFYGLESILIFTWLLFVRKRYESYDIKYKLIFNISFFYSCFILLTLKDATAVRMSWYFLIGPAVLISYDLQSKFKGYKTLLLIVLVYFSILFFRIMFVWDGGDFLPYKSIYGTEPRNGAWEILEYR